jgi:hypothetical protein
LSKFRGVLDAAREREQESSTVSQKGSRKKATKEPTPSSPPAKRGRGRPTGKRSDPDYEQVTSYVRKQTYADVKIKLIREGQKREFSELVEELLSKWLKSHD